MPTDVVEAKATCRGLNYQRARVKEKQGERERERERENTLTIGSYSDLARARASWFTLNVLVVLRRLEMQAIEMHG